MKKRILVLDGGVDKKAIMSMTCCGKNAPMIK